MAAITPSTIKATTAAYTKVAETLPLRLLNFFQKFPPGSVSQTPPEPVEITYAPNTKNNPKSEPVTKLVTLQGQRPTDAVLHPIYDPNYNPFLPWRNPSTERWRPAMYSLRRQADLCHLARQHGIEELLPYSSKLSWVKEEKRKEQGGSRVKGTGVGQKVKGKRWERRVKGTLEQRREAMRAMPALIRQWKERGHGRGWKKWPSGKAA